MKISKVLLSTMCGLLLTGQSVLADTCAKGLMPLFTGPQAKELCDTFSAGVIGVIANNTYAVARNAADSANINVWKVDATDDTVINADTGDVIKLALAGTAFATATSTGIIPVTADTTALGSQTLAFNPIYFGNGATYQGTLGYSAGNTSLVFGSLSNHEIEFRANGAEVWEMNPDGTLMGSGTGTIGWTVQSAANQACSTTCVTPCVFGQETTSKAILACSDATADSCLCAGAS